MTKFPFFQLLSERPQTGIGAAGIYESSEASNHQYSWIPPLSNTGDRQADRQEFYRRANQLALPPVVDKYRHDEPVPTLNGGIYVYPAKRFHSLKSPLIDWIRKAAYLLQDDEAVFSLYMANGCHIWSIDKRFDLPINSDISLLQKNTRYPFYLFHAGRLCFEEVWRTDSGIPLEAGCLNPAKEHLWRLPLMNKDFLSYPTDIPNIAVIFPIFQRTGTKKTQDSSIEHHLVKSAAWAAHSWYLHTDLVEMKVPLYFYVEHAIAGRAEEELIKNGIDIRDNVLYFHGKSFNNPPNHLGKKLAMFTDDTFADFDWVVQLDVDLFFSRQESTS